jgi:tetratricopeptide (TPR) repeat protein
LLATLEEGWSRNKRRNKGTRAEGFPVVLLAIALTALVQSAPALAQGTPDFQGPERVLAKGHAAYEEGRFLDAVWAYQKVEDMGVANAALYFDLGNAHFKSGNLGAAIAAYRRAERLAPRDDLLRSNLDYVLSLREDKAVHAQWPWPFSMIRSVYQSFSLNEWFVVAAIFYAFASALLISRLIPRWRFRFLRMAFVVTSSLLLLSAAALGGKVRAERFMQSGVVLASAVPAMSGPGEDYTVEFTLHEGTEVRVEVQRPQWLRVSLGGTLRGWVPAQSIEGY